MGADYVQIYTITEPHLEGGCFDNVYSIKGEAFRYKYVTNSRDAIR